MRSGLFWIQREVLRSRSTDGDTIDDPKTECVDEIRSRKEVRFRRASDPVSQTRSKRKADVRQARHMPGRRDSAFEDEQSRLGRDAVGWAVA